MQELLNQSQSQYFIQHVSFITIETASIKSQTPTAILEAHSSLKTIPHQTVNYHSICKIYCLIALSTTLGLINIF